MHLIMLSISAFVLVFAHDEDIHTIKYREDTFSQNVPNKNHFIMFYAPWCGHCQKFAPKWEQLAEMLNDDDNNNIKIAKVDCTTDSTICSDQDITGYPTLKFYKVGDSKGVRFRGTRDLPSLTTFINEQLREGEEESNKLGVSPESIGSLNELTELNFENHVKNGKHFIKFYAPWCGHCQKLASTWEQLAKSLEFETDVSIGKLDCTQYRMICNKFDIKGYPTLLWIENGKKLDKYQGDRSYEDLKHYVNKMLGSDKNLPEIIPINVENNFAAELTGDSFQAAVESGVTFVKFFAPWCGHCKRLSPTWDLLREKFSYNDQINIYKVDCTLEGNKQLCNDQEVEGFPTIFLYKNGAKISEYTGSRLLEDLHQFVSQHSQHDEL